MYADKCALSESEQRFLLRKNIVQIIYNTGKLESLNTTLLQTEEIVKYNRANNVSIDDVVTILNLKKGYNFIFEPVSDLLSFAKLVNKTVAAEDALVPGELRSGNVTVPTLVGVYEPEMPVEAVEQVYFAEIVNQGTTTEQALRIFLHIAKNKLFWDGNKRTATIVANKVLFDKGAGLFTVPEKSFATFNEILGRYYLDDASVYDEIMQFMHENTIFGIDYK